MKLLTFDNLFVVDFDQNQKKKILKDMKREHFRCVIKAMNASCDLPCSNNHVV